MHDTEGRRLLEKALKNCKQTWLAGLLRVSQPTVANWKAGTYRPEPALRTALRTVLGIPESAWLTPEERARLEELQALPPATGTDG